MKQAGCAFPWKWTLAIILGVGLLTASYFLLPRLEIKYYGLYLTSDNDANKVWAINKLLEKKEIGKKYLARFLGSTNAVERLENCWVRKSTEDPEFCTALVESILNGEDELFRLLAARGPDVGIGVFWKRRIMTPLQAAVTRGKINLAEFLIRRGADVNMTAYACRATPLSIACKNGDFAMVELLCNHRAETYLGGPALGTPLHQAVITRNLKLAEYLIAHGANVNSPYFLNLSTNNDYGDPYFDKNIISWMEKYGLEKMMNSDWKITYYSPLNFAAANDDLYMVDFLIEKGADINYMAGDRWNYTTPVMSALENNSMKVAEYLYLLDARLPSVAWAICFSLENAAEFLLDKFAPKYDYNNYGYNNIDEQHTLIHAAAIRPSGRIVEILLNHGADINSVEKCSGTPLDESIRVGMREPYMALKKRGGKRVGGKSLSFEDAIKVGDMELIPILIENASIEEKSKMAAIAVEKNYLDVVEFLLNAGAMTGNIIVFSKSPEMLKMLIEKGANVDGVDGRGRTILLNLTERYLYYKDYSKRTYSMIKMLLDAGANVNHVDPGGYSPLDYTEHFDDPGNKIRKLLKSFGAVPDPIIERFDFM